MPELFARYDAWLQEGGPSALIMKEYLEPAGGPEDIVFPPTFAPPENDRDAGSGYIIDTDESSNVCLLDSVGSQANRLEPIFKAEKYRNLVPQIEIRVD